MAVDHAAEYDAYREARARDQLAVHSGRAAVPGLGRVFDRFGDLFRPEEVATVDRAATDAFYERDRKANRMLGAALAEGLLDARAASLSHEITSHALRTTVDDGGRAIPYASLPAEIAREADAPRRARLLDLWSARTADVDDLRVERLSVRRDAAAELGASSEWDLVAERRGVDYRSLGKASAALLASTERAYLELIVPVRGAAGPRSGPPSVADMWYALQTTAFDAALPASKMHDVVRDVLGGLGVRIGAQSNVTFDLAGRPRQRCRPHCAAVRIPDEIVVSGPLRGGLSGASALLGAAGIAEHHAFTLPDVRTAFARAGDGSTHQVFGHLLARLTMDRAALTDVMGVPNGRAAGECARRAWVFQARAEAAVLAFAADALRADGVPSTDGRAFSGAMESWLDARVPAALCTFATERAFACGRSLRARAVEVLVREHLRVRFGRAWWRRRAAGDLLKELWATGSEYSPEELASELGLDTPTLDVLEMDLVEELTA